MELLRLQVPLFGKVQHQQRLRCYSHGRIPERRFFSLLRQEWARLHSLESDYDKQVL